MTSYGMNPAYTGEPPLCGSLADLCWDDPIGAGELGIGSQRWPTARMIPIGVGEPEGQHCSEAKPWVDPRIHGEPRCWS
jgi:hypothetical protein